MEPSDLLRYVVDVLQRLAIPYLVTGSTVTIALGEPRFTNDIDIVVDLKPEHVGNFCRSFPAPDFYVNEAAIRAAIQEKRQFNVIHPSSGLKVDFILRNDTPFDDSRFARGVWIQPAGDYQARFASVEDVIIKKMEFYRIGGSEKHLRDITGVLKVSGERIDYNYIAHWSSELQLDAIWRAIQDRLKE